MPKTILTPNISTIKTDFPNLNFQEAEVFYWSAKNKTIHYVADALKKQRGIWQLLHEISHATLGHKNFKSSVALLRMETEAWLEAKKLAERYNLTISQSHIEHCLDTYRDWLHKRSVCPTCQAIGLEAEDCLFCCFNCGKKWRSSSNQLNRCYRLSLDKQPAT